MKKFFTKTTTLLTLAFLLTLTACAENNGTSGALEAGRADAPAAAPTPSPTPEPPPEPTPEPEPETVTNGQETSETNEADEPAVLRGFTRGTWAGNTFTSPQFNVTFTMPEGWIAATDEEIADIMGLGLDFLDATGVELTPETIEMAGITVIQDMIASNPETGAMVQIMAERLFFPNTRITPAEYIEAAAEIMIALGMDVITDFPNLNLGGRTWHQYQSILDFGGFNIYGHYLLDIQDGFVFIIQFVYSEFSESAEEMFAMLR